MDGLGRLFAYGAACHCEYFCGDSESLLVLLWGFWVVVVLTTVMPLRMVITKGTHW